MRTEFHAPGRRSAFTLIEILLVLAIIGVLISLLLPAIQSSRELARRVSCQNNLMQLGTALGQYASSYGVLPPGVVNDRGPITGRPGGYRFSWAVQILPFLQQPAMYREFDFRHGVDSPANATARQHRIQTFLCPSEWTAGSMSYAGCHHDVEAPIAADNHGVFYLNSRTRYDDITDGPAFTIFLGEVGSSRMLEAWAVGGKSTLRNTGTPINGGPVVPIPGAGFTVSSFDSTDPNAAASAAAEEAMINPYVGGFRSAHPGGANFLFGDGSVRFLNSGTDALVYRHLGHRSDGELIDGDDF
jgi:prepilin-type N-terminal cleavage/methylation domain-containing protein/prepilin-type processing-associated H-X9-DG protein